MRYHSPPRPPMPEPVAAECPPIRAALVGNANVGKSVIFNQLTGLNQFVGNKTVELAEGIARFKNREFHITDLPGIYSLSTFSFEEDVTRRYLVENAPDFIVNVVDATNLERNLFLTLQLLMLRAAPVILVLNQWDLAKGKGLAIDVAKLRDIFHCSVIPAVAVHGRGVHEILENILDYRFAESDSNPVEFPLGREVERELASLEPCVRDAGCAIPTRFAALKLLEGDKALYEYFGGRDAEVVCRAESAAQALEQLHGESATSIISAELFGIVHKVVGEVQVVEHRLEKATTSEKLDHFTTHSQWGYVILVAILFGIYMGVFTLGDLIASGVNTLYKALSVLVYGTWGQETLLVKILWDGGMGVFLGVIGGVLPFVFLFYFFVEILQEVGYLPRAAFMMDSIMHRIGLHGKSIIPLIIGLGCNVPACAACRILETEQEKRINIFITTMVPCAARSTVVMGLVGYYLGVQWAALLYLVNFVVIAIMGRVAYKLSHGQNVELIIELHDFRAPQLKVIVKQTWLRGKEFVYQALPLVTIIGICLQVLFVLGVLAPINAILSPVTVTWLGLPVGVGIFLLYGILRKEMTLVLLVNFVLAAGMTVSQFMTPLQMFVFALVIMLYIPCITTIVVVGREVGWKFATGITVVEIGLALLLGGAINWGISPFFPK